MEKRIIDLNRYFEELFEFVLVNNNDESFIFKYFLEKKITKMINTNKIFSSIKFNAWDLLEKNFLKESNNNEKHIEIIEREIKNFENKIEEILVDLKKCEDNKYFTYFQLDW